MTPEVTHYLEKEAGNIDGWLHIVSQFLISELDKIQMAGNINGDIVEIGLWEGKTAILFSLLSGERNNVHEIDVEIRDKAKSNLARLGHLGGKNVVMTQESSLNLGLEYLQQHHPNGIRIFHVDGYHTRDVARNDLALAYASTQDTGVVMLDDFFSATLPGVTEAMFELFFQGRNNDFVPFAIGGAKVYLCKQPMVEFYREKVITLMPMPCRTTKDTEDVSRICGNTVAIYDLW